MDKKNIKIDIPEGYELDLNNSTKDEIICVLKKEPVIKKWEDIECLSGYYIDYYSDILSFNSTIKTETSFKKTFKTYEDAESALAYAQITQLLPYYNLNNEDCKLRFEIYYHKEDKEFDTAEFSLTRCVPFSFDNYRGAKNFIRDHEDLLRKYFKIE